MANPDEGQRVADRINQLLEPFMAPPIPESALVPAWFDEQTSEQLDRLCRKGSSEVCFFVPNADLSEPRRETIYEELSLPADEDIIAFLDLTDEKEGKRGTRYLPWWPILEKYVFYRFEEHLDRLGCFFGCRRQRRPQRRRRMD